MSSRYKIKDQNALYFITSTVVKRVDIFTRTEYKNIIVNSLKFCQKEERLDIYAWCIMTNHIHLIAGRSGVIELENIIRDFKKFTSVRLSQEIIKISIESRREWLLSIFHEEAMKSEKHSKYQKWQDRYHPILLSTNEMMDQ